MYQVEKHIITHNDPRWVVLDHACFLSKNLYNAGLYEIRQHYFNTEKSLSYEDLDKKMHDNQDYRALPAKVSQQVLMQVCHNWHGFWAQLRAFHNHPEKFRGRPKLPRYKHKTQGRNLLVYTDQAVSKRELKKGVISPSQLGISVKSDITNLKQVRIIPQKTHYVVEIVYTVEISLASPNPDRVASIDIGLNNLATVTTNQPDISPLLVNGRPLKSINQLYNKQKAQLQSQLPKGKHHSERIGVITDKRNNRINHYLHQASHIIAQFLYNNGIGTLIIGKNNGWKQEIELGSVTNQNFVQIPHARFIALLTYKATLRGINVILVNENYTSKCSFLDDEPIQKHKIYKGKRIHRGLFRASDGRVINADVNGALNIMKKVIPNVTSDGIGACVVMPERVTPFQPKRKKGCHTVKQVACT
ncbi:MAG: transposase [Anaerolineae bacterium]|nr:transposase [Anaerolineae bacterium]